MGTVGMNRSALGLGLPFSGGLQALQAAGLQWDLRAFSSDSSGPLSSIQKGRDGLCPGKWLCLEGPGWTGHQPGHWGRNHGAGAWHSALDKTKSPVLSVGGRCVSVSCDGSGVTVYMTYLCGYIALYLKEKFLLRSY